MLNSCGSALIQSASSDAKRIAFADASVCRAAYIFATCHLIIPDTAIATINIEMNISTKEKPATPVFCIYSPRHR